ncbi:hypothetical protein DFP72DRAFT_920668 [Ephemerocybe angulata]|uniref:ubiquitinyl hydrolase 1 n=1 Tax=Ephemerocybe angulata TaxID=980116 RepID=A0A8H6LX18_9AGAR|nr:hypothetical protein DFP72DRAFT_920668 [Tulosesus angulatus]
MAKQKPPTPQELYHQRRRLEEQERTAYLPPGLVNHGNTCFMNSVLQGLIATQLLSDLVHFAPIPQAVQERSAMLLAGQRSPQLTNGHNLSGPYDKPWVNTMPIGDVFLSIMYKSWDAQAKRQKDILSPKALLHTLGKKYDQYLDFAQQDAHEFLRILLDAMRMEELDTAAYRNPPPRARRKPTIIPPVPSTSTSPDPQISMEVLPELPEDQRLVSFVDLIFGGRLTSILVCQKCKNVSQTYEDFNDISLSIKPEDYIHRKRDKLKNFAKRLTAFPTSSSPSPFHLNPIDIQRPSSVPPSPKERPDGQLVPRDEPPQTSNVRRRSLDVPTEGNELDIDEAKDVSSTPDPNAESDSGHILVNVSGPENKQVEFVEVSSKTDKKDKRKSQVEENWAKLGRRLSLGLGKSKERKSRSAERVGHRVSEPIVEGVELKPPADDSKSKRLSVDSASTPRPSLSSVLQAVSGRTPSPDRRHSTIAASPSSLHPNPIPSGPSRSKSPKPPKATPAEAEYLRRILADVTPGGPSNPLHGNRMHQLSGIEECLRMFTAVEVLDGENMVGCRRCWKIANGQISKRSANGELEGDDSDSAGQNSPSTSQENGVPSVSPEDKAPLQRDVVKPVRPPLATQHIQPPIVSTHIPISISTPTVSFYAEVSSQKDGFSNDTRSISSLPTATATSSDSTLDSGTEGEADETSTLDMESTRATSLSSSDSESAEDGAGAATPGGLPIPGMVETTVVQPVNRVVAPKPTNPSSISHLVSLVNTTSKDSLPVPPKNLRAGRHGDVTTDDEESSAYESDTSFATSVSAESANGGPTGERQAMWKSPPGLDEVKNGGASESVKPPPQKKKSSKPKPVIMRPAYKRYLIDTPPPVLVIHLKRFQQLQKSPFLSFSHGFKKLDDYITFPEHLDLTPYLAPKKEDYGLGKKKGKGKLKGKEKTTADEMCMYRLYAVVVHIGNMLGGHYVAYTALPAKSPIEGEGMATKRKPPPPPPSSGDAPPPEVDRHGKQPQQRQWAYVSDTVVRLTTLDEVLSAKAYICMYERC